MNPDTGEFKPESDDTPSEWPRFAEGEAVEVKGVPFVIGRINRSSIVLRPVVRGATKESSVIAHLTGS